jgi:hypothetical protein
MAGFLRMKDKNRKNSKGIFLCRNIAGRGKNTNFTKVKASLN